MGTKRSIWVSGSSRRVSAGGNGSPCAMQDSAIFRARPWAISMASATVRPSATRPGTSTLVARKPPAASFSMRSRSVVFGHVTCLARPSCLVRGGTLGASLRFHSRRNSAGVAGVGGLLRRTGQARLADEPEWAGGWLGTRGPATRVVARPERSTARRESAGDGAAQRFSASPTGTGEGNGCGSTYPTRG